MVGVETGRATVAATALAYFFSGVGNLMNLETALIVPQRIVSGGQTGVDRAALDFAISRGIPHGGWCPAGRLAEDGPISDMYALQETVTAVYSERTLRNVEDSSATLILYQSTISGGTKLTLEAARRMKRPVLLVELNTACQYGDHRRVQAWLSDLRPAILNIAGPRESSHPGIYRQAFSMLERVFSVSISFSLAAGNERTTDQRPDSSSSSNSSPSSSSSST